MSQGSSSASSSSHAHGGGGPGYDGQGSPVAYRIGPLAYTPAVFCECKVKLKACRWISWSQPQPGRRYYRCQKSKNAKEDCGFFHWIDDEVSAWYKELLRDLRDTVWGLKKEVAKQEALVESKDMQLMAMQMEVVENNREVEGKNLELQVKQQDLNTKLQELTDMQEVVQALQDKLKIKNQCFDALLLFYFVLLIMVVVLMLKGNKA